MGAFREGGDAELPWGGAFGAPPLLSALCCSTATRPCSLISTHIMLSFLSRGSGFVMNATAYRPADTNIGVSSNIKSGCISRVDAPAMDG